MKIIFIHHHHPLKVGLIGRNEDEVQMMPKVRNLGNDLGSGMALCFCHFHIEHYWILERLKITLCWKSDTEI